MQTGNEHIDFDLLAKYLAGETHDAENAQVAAWLEADTDNQAVLDELRQVMDLTEQVSPPAEVDTDAAWNKMQQRMYSVEKGKIVEMQAPTTTATPWRIIGIAATLIGFLLAVGLVFNNLSINGSNQLMTAMAIDEIVIDSMKDGSVVTINQNSHIEYWETFTGGERRVDLVGEAFFEVAEDSTKPFVVDLGELEVTVLGTSFNVKANYEDDFIEVVVEAGKVLVADDDGQEVILLPGDKGIYYKTTGELVKLLNDNVAYQWWRFKKLVFSNTTLHEVVTVLNEQYKANLSLDDSTSGQCKFTGSFEDESLDTILQVIATTFNLQLEESAGNRVLKGKACEGTDI